MTCPNKSTITSYGAVVSLVDLVPRKNPSGEWVAAEINPLRNDVAALTQTQCICHCQVLGTAGTPIITGSSTWTTGVDNVYFGNNPVFVNNSTGNWTVTMPANVQDSFGKAIDVNLHGVTAAVVSGTTFARFICNVVSSNTFNVLIDNGGATNLVGSLIQFWIY